MWWKVYKVDELITICTRIIGTVNLCRLHRCLSHLLSRNWVNPGTCENRFRCWKRDCCTQGAIGYSSVSRGGSSLSVPSTYVSAEDGVLSHEVLFRPKVCTRGRYILKVHQQGLLTWICQLFLNSSVILKSVSWGCTDHILWKDSQCAPVARSPWLPHRPLQDTTIFIHWSLC